MDAPKGALSNHMGAIREEWKYFPKPECARDRNNERIKMVKNIPFSGLKTFLKMLIEYRTFYHLYTTGYMEGVIYHFPNFIIQYFPKNAYWGNVIIQGNVPRVVRVHREFKYYLTHFKTRRFDPKFDVNKEIRDYEFCRSDYMLRCILWAPDF